MAIGKGKYDAIARAIAEELKADGIVLVVLKAEGQNVVARETAILLQETSHAEMLDDYFEELAAMLRADATAAERKEVKPS